VIEDRQIVLVPAMFMLGVSAIGLLGSYVYVSGSGHEGNLPLGLLMLVAAIAGLFIGGWLFGKWLRPL
jgi:hypothetical protein